MKKIKIIFKLYFINIYGLLLINLMNWLDGVLTYIALFILPEDLFYETNNFVYNQFITIGFFQSFIFKMFMVASISIFLFLMINKLMYIVKLESFKIDLIVNNILVIIFSICFVMITSIVFQNALGLIIYYYF